jgi:hypothetical protein
MNKGNLMDKYKKYYIHKYSKMEVSLNEHVISPNIQPTKKLTVLSKCKTSSLASLKPFLHTKCIPGIGKGALGTITAGMLMGLLSWLRVLTCSD